MLFGSIVRRMSSSTSSSADTLVQYIAVRADLGFGTGALCAQAAHASNAAIFTSIDKADTRAYLSAPTSMHTVVLKAESEVSLRVVADALASAGVDAHLWVEQPEGVPTALATAPGFRSALKPFFGAFKLLR